MECQLDLPSVNAFLDVTSKPANPIVRPAAGHTVHFFDRLPHGLTGLVMQYLFPKRCAGEPFIYRLMRVQIVQSRQASYPTVREMFYQGQSFHEEVLEDERWKNGVDAVCKSVQQAIAMNLFSDFWKRPLSFSHDDTRYYFVPSPAFDKMPYITFLQRFTREKALRWKVMGVAHAPEENQKNWIKLHFEALRLSQPAFCAVFQDPMLCSYTKQRINQLELVDDLQGMQGRDRASPSANSVKMRCLTGLVALSSVMYAVCRAVGFVFKALAFTLLVSLPYLFIMSSSALSIYVNFRAIKGAIVFVHVGIFAIGAICTAVTSAKPLALKVVVVWFCGLFLVGAPMGVRLAARLVMATFSMHRKYFQFVKRYPFLLLTREIFQGLGNQFLATWSMKVNLIKNRTHIADFLVLRGNRGEPQ